VPNPPPHVLVIDDESVIQDLMRDILSAVDIQSEVAPSGELGLQALERNAAPLVFCDLRMPGLSGPELIRRLREMAPSASIILMSGNLEDEAVPSAMAAGAVGALQKPFQLNDVLDICRRHLPGFSA